MNTSKEIQDIAIQVIVDEKKAIEGLEKQVGDSFSQAVETIISASGRVVVTGIGKSANIASKIVSTLNSTGTPSLFLHAADAIHGDLGMVQPSDVVLCLSKSGSTPEIKVLVPLLKSRGATLIALTATPGSFLAREAHIVLSVAVPREACPLGLAPTSSTTAQLVMGDALAVALMRCRHFTADDFASLHPGGALGKQLCLRVSDLYRQNEKPQVLPQAPIPAVILEMTSRRLGCTAVVSASDPALLLGIITDGDLRRMLNSGVPLDSLTAADIMSPRPKTILEAETATAALALMRAHSITQLVVTDPQGRYLGIVHLHDILREGII